MKKRWKDAVITENGLKITPIEAIVPDHAKNFVNQVTALLPRVKITELLLEIDEWTTFTQHFTDLTSGEITKDKTLLLTAILADDALVGFQICTHGS